MTETPPVIISIPRIAVETCNPAPVAEILNSFIPHLCDRNRNRVQFEVLGYLEDPRELYDITEVRLYYQALFDKYPGLFYWIDTDSHMLLLFALMLHEPIRSQGQVTVSPADLQSFLLSGFVGLNEFCQYHGLSQEPANQAIRRWVGMDI